MSVTAPPASRAAGVAAGLKSSGDPDVALVVNDGPADAAAAVFTTNRFQAAPVLWTRQVLDGSAGAGDRPQLRRRQRLHRPRRLPGHPRHRRAGRRRLGLGADDVAVALHRPDRRPAADGRAPAGVDAPRWRRSRGTAARTPPTRS